MQSHGDEEEGMKGNRKIILVLGIALAAGCTNLPRSRDLGNPNVAGATLAQQVCSNCHGVTGTSVSPNMPNLAAQQPAYISAQLKLFRGRERLDPAARSLQDFSTRQIFLRPRLLQPLQVINMARTAFVSVRYQEIFPAV